MKTLTGAIKAKKGDVTFKGKALNQWKLKDLAKHIAILPQHPTAPEASTEVAPSTEGGTDRHQNE